MAHYDIIGDIHGHATELKSLLLNLGYQRSGYGFRHTERQIIFVGDFIDRGPEIAEVIQIARATVEDGYGHAVMGNHEFNAIAFHTRKPGSNEFFRAHSDKNQHQHQATLNQLSSLEMQNALAWFKTLPVALELDGVRVVHAAWQPQEIAEIQCRLKDLGQFTTDFLRSALDRTNPLYQAVENVLKGPEIPLPDGKYFLDADGHKQFNMRVRWYVNAKGMTLREYAIKAGEGLPDDPVPEKHTREISAYSTSEPPVFVGHYWLQGTPTPFAPNVACVDYSVAKNGKLCAYQWRPGETALLADRYVWVDAVN